MSRIIFEKELEPIRILIKYIKPGTIFTGKIGDYKSKLFYKALINAHAIDGEFYEFNSETYVDNYEEADLIVKRCAAPRE